MFQADKKPILFNKELTGNPITFNSRLKNMPFADCKVSIPIMQEGSGTPSPTNVREFIGVGSLAFGVTGVSLSFVFGQTIYSGILDIKTGVLSITHAIVDLGNLGYQYRDNYELFYTGVNTSIKLATTNCACSGYLFNPDAIDTSLANVSRKINDKEITTFSNENNRGRFVIKDTNYTDVASLKAAVTGIKLVYELAEPIQIPLGGYLIEALKGENNLISSVGTITAKIVEVK